MSNLSLINISVRDIPVSGLAVRLLVHDPSGFPAPVVYLEPSEAAELAAQLTSAAEEAVHESRARRRVTPRFEPGDQRLLGPDPTTAGFDPFRL